MYKQKPFISGFLLEIKDDDKLSLFNNNKCYTLSGQSTNDLKNILRLINGKNTVEFIAEDLSLPEYYVLELIETLKNLGIIKNNSIDGDFKIFDDQKEFLFNFLVKNGTEKSIDNYLKQLEDTYNKKIYLTGNCYLVNLLKEYLNKKILVVDSHKDADLILGVDFFENINLFRELNELSCNLEIPFFRCVLDFETLSIGPMFLSNETACYECFLSRVFSNLDNPIAYKYYNMKYGEKISQEEIGLLPGSLDIFFGLIETSIIKFFLHYLKCEVVGKELLIKLDQFEFNINPVLKLPYCESCLEKNYLVPNEGVKL